mmetsp:Transcript_30559/g.44398  ORF Transcript_30559/g.44398 Transcript_30559/m.44398 type:complete len:740 (-) Transcript_30559:233-2452(-)
MGIKGLNSWISSSFSGVIVDAPNPPFRQGGYKGKNARRRRPPNKIQNSYDHVLIDANEIVHRAFRRSSTENQVFRHIVRRLDEVFQNYPPRISALIALDGPGPNAKMLEQRKRRIYGALKSGRDEEAKIVGSAEYERRKAQAVESGGIWPPPTKSRRRQKKRLDTLRITPGTGFMLRLRMVLEWYAANFCSWGGGGHRQRPLVFVSGADVPGEGEIKLLEHLHDSLGWTSSSCSAGGNSQPQSFLLVGSDADLLLLGLAAGVPRCDVLTTDGNGNDKLFKVNVLCRRLVSNFGGCALPRGKSSGAGLYELDFLVISFLQGNDYLPKLSGVNPQRYLKNLVNILKEERWQGQHLLNIRDGTIVEVNLSLLVALVKGGGNNGTKRRCGVDIAKDEELSYGMEDTIDAAGADHVEDASGMKRGPDPNQYLTCLAWCAAMYLTGTCPDYTMSYQYRKAPTATELARFQNSKPNPQPFYEIQSGTKATPLPADVFSLCLLPGAAKEHIPFPLQSLMDEDGPLSDIFHNSRPWPSGLVPRITEAVESLGKAHWKQEDLMSVALGQISVFGSLHRNQEVGTGRHPFLVASNKALTPWKNVYPFPFSQANNRTNDRNTGLIGCMSIGRNTKGSPLQKWAWDPTHSNHQKQITQNNFQSGDMSGISTPISVSSSIQNRVSIDNQTTAPVTSKRKRARKASKKSPSKTRCRFCLSGTCSFGEECRFSHDNLAQTIASTRFFKLYTCTIW